MGNGVTVCIPSIQRRSQYLTNRAIPSVLAQTSTVDAISVVLDTEKMGAWGTRNRAISMATTEWIGFLDDDDELMPHHFELLLNTANANNADVVWGWFEVIGGTDPFPMHRGRQWDVNQPHIFPITCLVKRQLILDSNAKFCPDTINSGNWGVQDFPFWKKLHEAGGKFLAIPDTTWKWHHHGENTSGLPSLS